MASRMYSIFVMFASTLVGSTILTASERGYAICMVVEHKITASASDSDSESDID